MLCSAGTYASVLASYECLTCEAGKISVDADGNAYAPYSACQDCPTGSYAASEGSSECTLAAAGTYVNETGSTGYRTTPAGFYTVAESATYYQTPCSAGKGFTSSSSSDSRKF